MSTAMLQAIEAHAFLQERFGEGWDDEDPDLRDFRGYNEWFQVRSEYIGKFGFSIPSAKAIEAIRKVAPIVEVGAGCGYWTHELRKAGVDVVATDPKTGRYAIEGGGKWWGKTWVDVEPLDALAALRVHPQRTLLTVWPDYGAKWTDGMLEAYEGEHVVYVGEGAYGCTGSERFHELLEERFEPVEEVAIPHFPSIHDRLTVYRRKREVRHG